MGTGWSYFINVCQALRVSIGIVSSVIGCIVVYFVYGLVTQQMQAANPQPLVTTQTAGATVDPNAANSQFTTKSGPAAAVASPQQPGATTQPPAGGGPAVNPQFGAPSARPTGTVPAPTGTPGLIPGPPPGGGGKNPQFGR